MDEEAKIIFDKMNRNLETRNSYLTFCFYAKMEAFISVFYPNCFEYIHFIPQELSGCSGKIIKILCNYELVFIGCVNAFLFIQGYKKDKNTIQMIDYTILLLPIVFVIITIVILSFGVNYDALWQKYHLQYCKLKQYSQICKDTSLIVQSKYRKSFKAKFKYNKRYYYIVNREKDKI